MTNGLEPQMGEGEQPLPAPPQGHLAEARPIRVWPVFAWYIGAFFVCMAAQIPVLIAIVVMDMAAGKGPQTAESLFQTPLRFVAIALPAQLGLLALWWIVSTYGDPRARAFRAIGATSLSVASYVCFLAATIAVLWLGALLGEAAMLVFGDWEEDMFARMYENMTWGGGIVLVLFIALAPGFTEEFFFRGYMQRRLLARWSPAVAIPVVAILFAAFHGTPVWAITVLPLGFWFGILAWRTGSLWPGILCHGFINGSINAWRVGAKLDVWPEELSPLAYNVGLGVCLACLLASAWILFKYRPHESIGP